MPVTKGPGGTSREISHLVREKDMPQRQAVAAALSMARKGTFGRSEKRKAGRAPSRGSR